jgi:HNH endonuclease
MQDVELVLRFLAFNDRTHLNYNLKMRSFLNSHMRENRHINDEKADLFKSSFINACELSFIVFGDRAFRRYSLGTAKNPNGGWERSVNKALFDCIMFWFARYEKRQVVDKKDAIRESLIRLCTTDPLFSDSIMLGTGDISRVKTRFEIWGRELKSIVDLPMGERRLFSYAEKKKIFDADNTCKICGQRIETLDDAEVDHKKAYSSGGTTTLDNAQIAHAFCNRSKSVGKIED